MNITLLRTQVSQLLCNRVRNFRLCVTAAQIGTLWHQVQHPTGGVMSVFSQFKVRFRHLWHHSDISMPKYGVRLKTKLRQKKKVWLCFRFINIQYSRRHEACALYTVLMSQMTHLYTDSSIIYTRAGEIFLPKAPNEKQKNIVQRQKAELNSA